MELLNFISESFSRDPGMFFIIGFVLMVGLIAKIMLFSKTGHRWWAAFIPVYDFIILLKIVGRPPLHIFLVLIPVFNLYFIARVFIELAQSFGKYTVLDYLLILVFSVFYVMNLGLSFTEVYYGAVYGKPMEELKSRKVPAIA